MSAPSRSTYRVDLPDPARLVVLVSGSGTLLQALLDATADANTDPTFGENTVTRILDDLPRLRDRLEAYGEELAAELLASHRRVRSAAGEIVRGVTVTPQKPADVLGVYVYLPFATPAPALAGGNA